MISLMGHSKYIFAEKFEVCILEFEINIGVHLFTFEEKKELKNDSNALIDVKMNLDYDR